MIASNMGFLFGVIEMLRIRYLYNLVTILKASELYTLKLYRSFVLLILS